MKVWLLKAAENFQDLDKKNKVLHKSQVIQNFIERNQNKNVNFNFDKLSQKLAQKYKKNKTILEKSSEKEKEEEMRNRNSNKTFGNNFFNTNKKLTNYATFATLASLRKTAKFNEENSDSYCNIKNKDKIVLPELNLTNYSNSKNNINKKFDLKKNFNKNSCRNKNSTKNIINNNIYNNSYINTESNFNHCIHTVSTNSDFQSTKFNLTNNTNFSNYSQLQTCNSVTQFETMPNNENTFEQENKKKIESERDLQIKKFLKINSNKTNYNTHTNKNLGKFNLNDRNEINFSNRKSSENSIDSKEKDSSDDDSEEKLDSTPKSLNKVLLKVNNNKSNRRQSILENVLDNIKVQDSAKNEIIKEIKELQEEQQLKLDKNSKLRLMMKNNFTQNYSHRNLKSITLNKHLKFNTSSSKSDLTSPLSINNNKKYILKKREDNHKNPKFKTSISLNKYLIRDFKIGDLGNPVESSKRKFNFTMNTYKYIENKKKKKNLLERYKFELQKYGSVIMEENSDSSTDNIFDNENYDRNYCKTETDNI